MKSEMNLLVLLALFCVSCASFETNALWQVFSVSNPSLRSSMTNNSFEFIVYKNHKRFDDYDSCLEFVFRNYKCNGEKLARPMLAKVMNGEDIASGEMDWLETYNKLENILNMSRVLPNFPAPAVLSYVISSRAFSTEVSQRGSPGLWSCYIDFLADEYRQLREITLKNNLLLKNNDVVPVYSGIQNSVIFNFTRPDGSINIEVGQYLTVSGYLSTTTNKEQAIMFGSGATAGAYNSIMLDIKILKENSSGASLNIVLPNGQDEVLFPTNVKFRVLDIISRDSGKMDQDLFDADFLYEVVVEETPTERFHTEVSGADPDEKNYICDDGSSSSSHVEPSSAPNSHINSLSSSSRNFSFAGILLLFLFLLIIN